MESRSQTELKQIALAIYKGQLFTNKHLTDPRDLTRVFMPLTFLSKDQEEALLAEPPGLIFEDMAKAIPMSVNGMPMFMSVQMLTEAEAERVMGLYERLRAAEAALLVGEEATAD